MHSKYDNYIFRFHFGLPPHNTLLHKSTVGEGGTREKQLNSLDEKLRTMSISDQSLTFYISQFLRVSLNSSFPLDIICKGKIFVLF